MASMALLPGSDMLMLECSAAIWLTAASASGLGDSPASASQVARTIGVRHHTQIIFVFLVETGFHLVGQDALCKAKAGGSRGQEIETILANMVKPPLY
ncbi:hypothetical protein AAY473_019463 [Plecturocebus cupreus]